MIKPIEMACNECRDLEEEKRVLLICDKCQNALGLICKLANRYIPALAKDKSFKCELWKI